MRYIDLFAGIGGFHYGIERAFADHYSERIQQGGSRENLSVLRNARLASKPLCVYSNEWDKYANSVYRKHFGECDIHDIRTVRAYDIPDHDLLCAGFPCQAFSVAGKRKGFEDTRGTLFFEIARIIKTKRPRLLLLENVKGLLSHEQGRTFTTILGVLDEIGYDVQWQVCNSKDFGVPQSRERVYIVGHLRGTRRPQVFPIGAVNSTHLQEITSGVSDAQRIYRSEGLAKTLKGLGGGLGAKTGLYDTETFQYKGLCDKLGVYASTQETNAIEALSVLQKEIGTEAFAEWGLRILDSLQAEEVLQPILHGKSVRHQTNKSKPYVDDGSLSRKKDVPESSLLLLWESKNRCSPQESRLAGQFIRELGESLSQLSQQTSSFRIRRLTPVEAERLQGFPDDWTSKGHDFVRISDSQRYKMLGNAVTTNVITAIVSKLLTNEDK